MMIWINRVIARHTVTVITITAVVLCLSACTSTASYRTGQFSNRLVSETKDVSTKPLSMTVTARPTIELPVMKFVIDNPNRDFLVKRYQKEEKVKQVTSHKPLSLGGIASSAIGLIYFFTNPAPDPTQYVENEYNSLSDDSLAARQTGIGIVLLGGGLWLGAKLSPPKTTFINDPINTFEERVALPPPSLKVPIIIKIQDYKMTDTTDENGQGMIQVAEALRKALFPADKWPENVELRVSSAGLNDNVTGWSLEEAVALMTSGRVDWSKGQAEMPPYPEARIEIPPVCKADEDIALKITVSNKNGKGDCYRLRGWIRSEELLFNKNVLIGHLKAGEEQAWEENVHIPREWLDRNIALKVVFEEFNNNAPQPLEARISMEGLPRPAFAYYYQFVDDGAGDSVGNGDGRIQKGESIDVAVTVKNFGRGIAKTVTISLSGDKQKGVELTNPKPVTIAEIQPGAVEAIRFNIVLKKDVSVNELPLKLEIKDGGEFGVSLVEPLKIPIDTDAVAVNKVTPLSKTVYVKEKSAEIRGGAGKDMPLIAASYEGAPLEAVAQSGNWYKVKISDTESGWITTDAVAEALDGAPLCNIGAIRIFHKGPPDIVVFQSENDALETSNASVRISGLIAGARPVQDVRILVNNKSVSAGQGIDLLRKQRPEQGQISDWSRFARWLPVDSGQNEIKIMATDETGLTAYKTLTVRRIEEKGKIYVLVVGISDYPDKSIPRLPYAEVDAKSVYDFYANNPKSIADENDVFLLTGKNADSRTIRDAMKYFSGHTRQQDVLICYYAGHSTIGIHPERASEYYLVPYDASKADLHGTAIELPELRQLWAAIPAKNKVFIADYCNACGLAELAGQPKEGFERGLGKDSAVIAASNKGQKALDVPDLKQGLFTGLFLDGLKGGADNDGDGKISLLEIDAYLKTKVPAEAETIGGQQQPVSNIEITGVIYLTK